MHPFLLALLMTQTASKTNNGMSFIIMILSMILVMYFLMIRPQSKKMNQQKQFAESLVKGAKVVTTGGIHGKVIGTDENTILLEIDNNVKIKVDRSAISMELTNTAYNSTETKSK